MPAGTPASALFTTPLAAGLRYQRPCFAAPIPPQDTFHAAGACTHAVMCSIEDGTDQNSVPLQRPSAGQAHDVLLTISLGTGGTSGAYGANAHSSASASGANAGNTRGSASTSGTKTCGGNGVRRRVISRLMETLDHRRSTNADGSSAIANTGGSAALFTASASDCASDASAWAPASASCTTTTISSSLHHLTAVSGGISSVLCQPQPPPSVHPNPHPNPRRRSTHSAHLPHQHHPHRIARPSRRSLDLPLPSHAPNAQSGLPYQSQAQAPWPMPTGAATEPYWYGAASHAGAGAGSGVSGPAGLSVAGGSDAFAAAAAAAAEAEAPGGERLEGGHRRKTEEQKEEEGGAGEDHTQQGCEQERPFRLPPLPALRDRPSHPSEHPSSEVPPLLPSARGGEVAANARQAAAGGVLAAAAPSAAAQNHGACNGEVVHESPGSLQTFADTIFAELSRPPAAPRVAADGGGAVSARAASRSSDWHGANGAGAVARVVDGVAAGSQPRRTRATGYRVEPQLAAGAPYSAAAIADDDGAAAAAATSAPVTCPAAAISSFAALYFSTSASTAPAPAPPPPPPPAAAPTAPAAYTTADGRLQGGFGPRFGRSSSYGLSATGMACGDDGDSGGGELVGAAAAAAGWAEPTSPWAPAPSHSLAAWERAGVWLLAGEGTSGRREYDKRMYGNGLFRGDLPSLHDSLRVRAPTACAAAAGSVSGVAGGSGGGCSLFTAEQSHVDPIPRAAVGVTKSCLGPRAVGGSARDGGWVRPPSGGRRPLGLVRQAAGADASDGVSGSGSDGVSGSEFDPELEADLDCCRSGWNAVGSNDLLVVSSSGFGGSSISSGSGGGANSGFSVCSAAGGAAADSGGPAPLVCRQASVCGSGALPLDMPYGWEGIATEVAELVLLARGDGIAAAAPSPPPPSEAAAAAAAAAALDRVRRHTGRNGRKSGGGGWFRRLFGGGCFAASITLVGGSEDEDDFGVGW